MIPFTIYSQDGEEFEFLMSNDRVFYWDDEPPLDRVLGVDPLKEADLDLAYPDSWRNEIRPQLHAIRDMTDEEFVLFQTDTRMMIDFELYTKDGRSYHYSISNDRKRFYHNFSGRRYPVDMVKEDPIHRYHDIWVNEIKPQMLAIQNMSDEEWVFWKLRHG